MTVEAMWMGLCPMLCHPAYLSQPLLVRWGRGWSRIDCECGWFRWTPWA